MTYPAFDNPGSGQPRTGPVTCSSCGCRLTAAGDGRQGWYHFSPMDGRDARGCRVACADRAHDEDGRASSS
jgi:hypothetical protein